MQPLARLSLALGLSFMAISGCGRSSLPPVAASAPSEAPAAAAASPPLREAGELRDGGWERVRVARLSLTLELPDAERWRETAGGAWAQLEHRASRSRLELSLTRAERLVRPEDCEARARLEHPELPRPAEGEALDQRRLRAPRGFHSYATVSVNEAGNSELEGHVTAFGAAVSRCFAFHFVTRVSGARAENEIARRLGLVVERLLPSIAPSAVDDRVSPERFPRMNGR